jgi:hypothetical protein
MLVIMCVVLSTYDCTLMTGMGSGVRSYPPLGFRYLYVRNEYCVAAMKAGLCVRSAAIKYSVYTDL